MMSLPQTSKEFRAAIVATMQEYAVQNPADYHAYMIACSIAWLFRDSPTGMSTVNQQQTVGLVHEEISSLVKNRESNEILDTGHYLIHKLNDYLTQKLSDREAVSLDDHGFNDEGNLIQKHASDFDVWAVELDPNQNKDK